MKYAVPAQRELAVTKQELAARIDALVAMSSDLRRAVANRTEAERCARAGSAPDAFSLHEHVWHLRDIEVLGYSHRLRAIATEENALLPDIDGTQLAIERAYFERPVDEALLDFERERAANVARLRALPLAAFERRGELEGVGCIALFDLLERWCEHDAGHRREIAELPRLGTGS